MSHSWKKGNITEQINKHIIPHKSHAYKYVSQKRSVKDLVVLPYITSFSKDTN